MNVKALRNGDFALAVEFFACGRKCLGPNPWEVNFDTMLKLCSEEAKATFITGDFDTMNVHIDEILSKDIPITDKYKAYEVKILYVQEVLQNFQKSLDIAIDVRRQLGMQAPKNKPHSTLKIVYEFLKTNRALGKMTAEDLLASLPDLSDERVIMGIRVLNLMGNASFSVSVIVYRHRICWLYVYRSSSSCCYYSGTTHSIPNYKLPFDKRNAQVWLMYSN